MNSKKTIQLSVVSNQLKKEFWIHPILAEAISYMTMQLGRKDSKYNLISEPQIGHEVSQVARNFAAWHCLEGHRINGELVKPDYLFMIDSDMSPLLPGCWSADGQEKVHHLIDLVKKADELDLDIFGAVYPGYKYQEWFLHVYHKNKYADALYESFSIEELKQWRDGNDALKMVDAIGTGAIVIHRRVLELISKRNQERGLVDPISGKPVVFERGRDCVGRTFHGEDLLFCTRARELGFQVWTSIDFLYDHFHTMSMLEIPAWDMGASGPQKAPWKVEDYGLPKDWKLPEITAWSMTPGGCGILRELISRVKKDSEPISVLEFGPGISSLVLCDCLDYSDGHWSMEHNTNYYLYLDGLSSGYGWTVYKVPLVKGFYESFPLAKYNLIIVDGPPSHEGTREPAMYKVWEHWAVGGYLVLDDAQREPERSIVEKWKADFVDRVECEIRADGYGRELAIFRKVKE